MTELDEILDGYDGYDGYEGPATLVVKETELLVTVDLRGRFEPIDGRYRWYGRIAVNDELSEQLGGHNARAVLRTPDGEATGQLSDPDPYGRYRIVGMSTPPFARPTLEEIDPEHGDEVTTAPASRVRTGPVRTPDGLTLVVRQTGDPANPTIVCLHGWPDTSRLWDGVVAELQDRFHVVAYDLRGFGGSDKPRRVRDYTFDKLESDFAAVVDAVSPDRPVHLLAHDWGSCQGWYFLSGDRLVGRIASFTSISGPSLDLMGHRLRGRPKAGQVRDLMRQLGSSLYTGAFHVPVLPEVMMQTFGRLAFASLRRLDPRSELPSGTSVRDTIHGLNLYRANIVPSLIRARVRPTDVPVQVIAPKHDPYVDLHVQTDVAEVAHNLQIHTVEGGHWIPRTHTSLIAALIAAMVERTEVPDAHQLA